MSVTDWPFTDDGARGGAQRTCANPYGGESRVHACPAREGGVDILARLVAPSASDDNRNWTLAQPLYIHLAKCIEFSFDIEEV